MLNIGITTKCFDGMSVHEVADILMMNGFRCTELCFNLSDLSGWQYNKIGSLEGITPARVKEAANEFRSRGIEVTSLGLYTDLRSPDPAYRAAVLDYCKRYIEFAAEAGIRYIGSDCGFTPGKRGINADSYESDYISLKDMLRTVCLEAEKSGVQLSLEGCVLDIIPSPRRMKTLIEELEADSNIRLTALINPSKYIANSDEEGMFCYLKHDIGYFIGKDRKLNSLPSYILGDGDIDWKKFMECYIRFADKKPFILDSCNAGNCGDIKQRAEDFYDDAFQTIISRIY